MKNFKLTSVAIFTFLLGACGGGGGGGGGGGDSSPPPAPEVPEVPTGSTGDSASKDSPSYVAEKNVIFTAINTARTKAGLAPVKQNTKLDTAAQGHADYINKNGRSEQHLQTQSQPGFTGENPVNRISAQSYSAAGVGEVIGYGAQPVDRLLASIYHRIPLLDAQTADIGIGASTYTMQLNNQPNDVAVIDYGFVSSDKAIPNASGAWVWPADGATNITRFYAESPSPAPDVAVLGHAISVTVNPGDAISTETFSVNCGGQNLAARVIASSTDINKLVAANWVFLQPEVELPMSSTCVAAFAGSSNKLGRFSRTWSFLTAAN